MEKSRLSRIQQEILKAIEQLEGKAIITEANIAKKIRENTKFTGKKKASLELCDVEKVLEYLEENGIFYSIHLNSANDILLKKDSETSFLNPDAKRRRTSSEKSMTIFTSSDFNEKNGPKISGQRIKMKKERMTGFNQWDDCQM